MKTPPDLEDRLAARAGDDPDFRERLVARPKETIEREFGVTLAAGHEIHVHAETPTATHVVLPPPNRYSEAERQEAMTGAGSLEFLKKTMYDPAPAKRPAAAGAGRSSPGALAGARDHGRGQAEPLQEAAREGIRRGLAFLESTVDENGAWHCIRFNLANPDIPRHYEKPGFVSALCVLALERCREARAAALCAATRAYLVSIMEYPGLWRYYRHLPPDLDSTALCSLVIGTTPGSCSAGTFHESSAIATRRAVS